MTTDDQLGMASGSKTFTALVVLCLVEEGLLDLSTTARHILRADLPLIADDVTIEHLLSPTPATPAATGRALAGRRLTQLTMSGADAGASFWSSHYPERGTTATVISTTIGGAWPVAEIVDSHACATPPAVEH